MSAVTTKRALKAAIRRAGNVYVQPRFGCSEHWLRITKSAALELADTLDDNTTPGQAEMFANRFGDLIDGALYIG